MHKFHSNSWWLVAASAGVVAAVALSRAAGAQPPTADDEGIEVLTRGPVHEAFAATVAFDPEEGLVAPRAPPDAIEELPPDQRPAGANVDWIPGYWAWDDEREDFLWVSGLWRNLPPGREWVAGYWNPSGDGAQWTSGYWADAASTEREYLPEPPATAEAGPNIEQPSPDYNWLPGSWTWQQNRYAWRPGFWAAGQENWDWVPPYYQWTPRGYVYIDGYYDYPVERRGVLFSPVYFSSNVYGRRGFSYSPSLAINLAGFTNHLFLRPQYGHYYFGDYYGSNYSMSGYFPWYAYGSSGFGYDPFYAQQRWQHRRDDGWAQQVENEYHHRRDHDDARPPRTWSAQEDLLVKGQSNDRSLFVATPYDEMLKSQETLTRYQPVDQSERERFGKRGHDVQQFRKQRQQLEADTAEARPDRERQPARVKSPRSPVVAQPADQLDKDQALPERHQAPAPDLQVNPKPRQRRGQPGARGKPESIAPQQNPQCGANRKSQGKPRDESSTKPQGTPNQSSPGERKERSANKPQAPSGEATPRSVQGTPGAKPKGGAGDSRKGAAGNKPEGGSRDNLERNPDE